MNCKRTISAFLALAAGLSMAACTNAGQSASSSSAASSAVSSAAVSNIEAASSSSSASSAPQIKLTLAVSPDTSAPLLGGLYAARKQGYFASYGLDVTITTAKSAAQAVDLASAG
ncbi:MAG: ABC transporter substrate-binding protein, partial [Oscillospiraceae bacterium]|nr:ABC transporter substrate-binding protein [Oscillospiraceae bacterium]